MPLKKKGGGAGKKERKAPSLTLAQGVSQSPLPAMDKEGIIGTTGFYSQPSLLAASFDEGARHSQTAASPLLLSMAHKCILPGKCISTYLPRTRHFLKFKTITIPTLTARRFHSFDGALNIIYPIQMFTTVPEQNAS